jgi:GNAT superfamily N-acetyltransferase
MSDGLTEPLAIIRGYRPGLLGRIAEMHALSYSRAVNFGLRFEAVVAAGLAEFGERLDRPQNAIWAASRGGTVVGAVAIDGEDLRENRAHLRWFIVSDGLRGEGIGRKLLSEALAFVDQRGFAQTELWTFRGLDAARKLYENTGFVCVEERLGDQWGREVLEQRFVRPGVSHYVSAGG